MITKETRLVTLCYGVGSPDPALLTMVLASTRRQGKGAVAKDEVYTGSHCAVFSP